MLTYEQLGEEVAKLNHADMESHVARMGAPGAQALALPDVCSLYKKVRGYLAIIVKIPLIPAPIRTAVSGFMSLMDTLCP